MHRAILVFLKDLFGENVDCFAISHPVIFVTALPLVN